jgi:hypothetical protein
VEPLQGSTFAGVVVPRVVTLGWNLQTPSVFVVPRVVVGFYGFLSSVALKVAELPAVTEIVFCHDRNPAFSIKTV